MKKKPTIKTTVRTKADNRSISLLPWQQLLLAMTGLILINLLLYGQLVFQGMIYPGGDNVAVLVNNHQILRYMEVTGQTVFWNPYPWGGIPNIFFLPRSVLSVDFYLHSLSTALSLPFVFSMLGGVGMFLFLRYLKMDLMLAFFGAAIFILLPYQKSLIIVGHLDKFQAVMYMPWIIYAIKVLLDKGKWWSIFPLALALGLQLRSGHYQVSFYTAVLMGVVILYFLIAQHRSSKNERVLKKMSLLVVAAILTLGIAAQPLFLVSKYAGQSVRGQHVLRLDSPAEENSEERGVPKDFVKQWSFKPIELASLLVPHAVGGTSDERMSNADARRLNQRVIDTYWGNAPFSNSYYYLGMIPVLLLLFGMIFKTKADLKWPLVTTIVLMLIWSLGTFAEPLYSLFYFAVPFFKNFRTPTTSLVGVNFALPILACYGLRSFQVLQKKEILTAGRRDFIRWIWLCVGIILGMLVIGLSASFSKSGQNFDGQTGAVIREIRQVFFYKDFLWIIVLAIVTIATIWASLFRNLNKKIAIPILALLSLIDLGYMTSQYSSKPISENSFNAQFLAKNSTTDFLQADRELFRVLPHALGDLGLTYYVQTIGGGFELQMWKNAYEIFYNNLRHKLDGQLQVNWNILDIMNVKYVVSERELTNSRLSLEHTDLSGKFVYRYKFNRPRAFFVDEYRVVAGDRERLLLLNNSNVDLRRIAILEETPDQEVGIASQSSVELFSYSPNKAVFTVETATTGLFVISELFAPDNQSVFIDGDPVDKVYKTNHLIQSVIVPQGLHTIEVRYDQPLFKTSALLSKISFVFTYLILLVWGYIWYRKER